MSQLLLADLLTPDRIKVPLASTDTARDRLVESVTAEEFLTAIRDAESP